MRNLEHIKTQILMNVLFNLCLQKGHLCFLKIQGPLILMLFNKENERERIQGPHQLVCTWHIKELDFWQKHRRANEINE